MNYLSDKNPHPNDSHITFDEGPHIYTIDGDSNYMSVTTFNHSNFEHFDSDKIIQNMMNSPNWSKNKYYGLTVHEIKQLWENNRNEAANAGTKMHFDIECYYNKCPNKNESIEYKYFMDFVKDHNHLIPYRTEWMVYKKDIRLAGSIDMTFVNDDGTISIYDWKRSKEIIKNSRWNKYSTTDCISHLPDTNFWHYSLQLNTYREILETEYNKIVKDMFLVCLHPDNKNNSYQLFKVPQLHDEINDLFKIRKLQI